MKDQIVHEHWTGAIRLGLVTTKERGHTETDIEVADEKAYIVFGLPALEALLAKGGYGLVRKKGKR